VKLENPSFYIHPNGPLGVARCVTENGDCRLQLCDKQHPAAVATATQFGQHVSGKVCSCTVAGLAALPADMVTAATAGDRSASPASPVNSNPDSPVGRGDSTPGVSMPEDLRGTSRSAPATSTGSSGDREGKNSTDT
jgi:hypothetical protein